MMKCDMMPNRTFTIVTFLVIRFAFPQAHAQEASLKQPAGYIPTTMAEYMGARRGLSDQTKKDFTEWKAKHLKTPEQIIKQYWETIRREAKKQRIQTDVLAAVLLNEMRAFNNKDFNNDLYYFHPLWETLGPPGIEIDRLEGQYPSIGIAQLRVDTVMKRKLLAQFMSKREREMLHDVNHFPLSGRLDDLSSGETAKIAAALIDPEFSIRAQAAHIGQMTAKIDKTVWGIQDASGNAVPFPAKLLRTPDKLTPQQREAFIYRLIKNYPHGTLTKKQVEEFIDNGAAYFMLMGGMIDDYWENQTNPNFAPFRFKVPWGKGIWESFRDIGIHVLEKNPPDWDAFLKNRRVYDEDGEYGEKGKVISLPSDLKISMNVVPSAPEFPPWYVRGKVYNANDGDCDISGKHLTFALEWSNNKVIVAPGESLDVALPPGTARIRAFVAESTTDPEAHGSSISLCTISDIQEGWWCTGGCSDGTHPETLCGDGGGNTGHCRGLY